MMPQNETLWVAAGGFASGVIGMCLTFTPMVRHMSRAHVDWLLGKPVVHQDLISK